MQNLKENWLVLSKMAWGIWLILFQTLKISDFIFESKMVELNQNKKFRTTRSTKCSVWNSTINKTFYVCSTKSLFLRYKKNSKKAVKLGSFLQCSVLIFLGHDACFWKINLRIFWNHIMKNFQVQYGQSDSIIFP